MNLQEAQRVAHTLSRPSKMPCYGYSIPASTCQIGSLLRKVAGSVCSKCYALKGRYVFQNVQKAMWKRFESLRHPQWSEAMAFQIEFFREQKGYNHFRWHDSGDLQGVWHLENIIKVCQLTPKVRHWLPTREVGIVRQFLDAGNQIPSNLVIRIASPKIGSKMTPILGLPVSTVSTQAPGLVDCEASLRGGKCGDCRACWSPVDINYQLH